MHTKSYYRVLGISRTEGPSGIRAAYRELAKKLHPDVAGEHSAGAFREITEAYATLSDPVRRQDYNARLIRAETHDRAPVTSGKPVPDHTYSIDFEALLTKAEAMAGCVVPLELPVLSGGRQMLHVHVPPAPRSGSVVEISLDGVGVAGFRVRMRVFVEE